MPLLLSVTCPDMDTARQIARAALEGRLAACANILPGVESHYWWVGALEQEREVLLSFKTVEAHRAALVTLIGSLHPYDLPAITWVQEGAPKEVQDWVSAQTRKS